MKLSISLTVLLGLVSALAAPTVYAQPATETVVHSFNGTDGVNPDSALIIGSDGNYYGTTHGNGQDLSGTIFQLTPSGTLTTLYTFSPPGKNDINADGIFPSGLVQAADGSFYGTTQYGGPSGRGTIFQFTTSGTLNTLYAFASVNGSRVNQNGAEPIAPLVEATDGTFYGTTTMGGGGGTGVVFNITSSGVYTVLHRFGALDDSEANTDGAAPYAALIQASNGNFFGTTMEGGAGGHGTVYKITPKKAFATLYSFSAYTDTANKINLDGANPVAPLLQLNTTTFYGTAAFGGSGGGGTDFKITTGGVLTTLYNFNRETNYAQGHTPYSGLIKGPEGLLYGTTDDGGEDDIGTVYTLTLSGHLHTIYDFAIGTREVEHPYSQLLLAGDGTLYGTSGGGESQDGTIYQITPPD